MSTARQNARTRGKRWELEAAKALGTTRTGPTGVGNADVLHETIALECKALSRLQLREDHLQQATKNAKGRIPVLALKEFGTGRKLAVVPWDFFLVLMESHERPSNL